MKFEQAFAVLRKRPTHKAIRLPEWPTNLTVRMQKTEPNESNNTNMYLYRTTKLSDGPWSPDSSEIMREDWEVEG